MKMPSKIRFADEKLKKAFSKLENGDKSEKELFKIINQAFDNIVSTVFKISGSMTYQEVGDSSIQS